MPHTCYYYFGLYRAEQETQEMLPRQEKIQRFLWGMSILNSYISFNSELNFHDINIVSENFMRDMMNILYNINLESPTNKNNPGN